MDKRDEAATEALAAGARVGFSIFIYPDRVDCRTHADAKNGWELTREAMIEARTEIDRIIREGRRCPLAPAEETR